LESHAHAAFANQARAWPERLLGEVCENLDKKRVPITKGKREVGEVPYWASGAT
jgi:type I restriction enzyme S subunit